MRVGLDATPLALSSGGLRRYVEELSRALTATFPEDQYLLLSEGGAHRSVADRRWWLFGLNRELARVKADLFHGTNFEVPYIPRRASVLTIHDLSPWMDPTWHDGAARVRRRTPLLLRFGLATMVITVSETVRKQALERFGLSPQRVVEIPLAPAAHLQPSAALPQRPYFLYLGTVEPRKNVPLLIEAWRAVRGRADVDLVIAGRFRRDAPAITAEPGLCLLGEVHEEDLGALYSGAIACLYPSLYEGFGLPVVEAMQCGAMVIASRDSAITEVAGGAAVQLDARDRTAWAEAMLAAATQPEWREQWRARALAHAKQYSWAHTARRTHEVYEEALRRFRFR